MVIFDASYLVVLLYPTPPPAMDRQNKPVLQFKERIEYLVSEMDVKSDHIGVPTPAMAEVLVRAGKGRAKYVKVLSDTWKFQLLPFDSRAAIEASELIAKLKSSNEHWDTWAKLKFDIQIVSIAKAESCNIIYSDDTDVERYATRLKMKVIRICDLPLPPPPEPEVAEISGPIGTQGELPLRVPNAPTALGSSQAGENEQESKPKKG